MVDELDALQAALDAEHAAIYAYGPIGARLTAPARTAAEAAEAEHRRRRDALAALLSGAGATPRPAAPAYRLPRPVTTAAGALALAVTVEERAAAAWRAVLPVATEDADELAVDALADCAVRAAEWRLLARPGSPPTVPFPGA